MPNAPHPWIGAPVGSTLELSVSNDAGFAARATVLTVSGGMSRTDRLFHHDLAGTTWSSYPLSGGGHISAHLHLNFLSAAPVDVTVDISVVDAEDNPSGRSYSETFMDRVETTTSRFPCS